MWLVALCFVLCEGAIVGLPPQPPRQTPVQALVMDVAAKAAPAASAAATPAILEYLNDVTFRKSLQNCCNGTVASLSAHNLYEQFKAEVEAMEMVHNWDPRPNGSPMDELNLTTWDAARYDYNLWEMSYLGLKHASFLSNCDLAEVGLMGFPPFKNASHGELPHTFAEATDRPTYTALNLWFNSMGNPKFGPVAVVFAPEYVRNMTMLLPVDSGLWEGSCNKSHRHSRGMNCSSWNRTDAHPLLVPAVKNCLYCAKSPLCHSH